ncbi:MAG TPA: hypothetical protein VGK84_05025 [Candidatus Tumulicola sp.]
MTPGASIMDVPWETVVENYTHELGEHTFVTLDEYATDFFAYIETSSALFPPRKQAECFRRCVRSIWSDYRDRVKTCGDSLSVLLGEDRRELAAAESLTAMGPAFGADVVASYAAELDELEREVFDDMRLTKPLRAELRESIALMYGKDWCLPCDDNSIVVAGMGAGEAFPSALAYAASNVVAGKLRRVRQYAVRIGPDCDSGILPFGRRETIDTIIDGVHPDLLALTKELRGHVYEHYSSPFTASVAQLSRRNLARMAESLVALSAIDQPLQVALLTKGDGARRRS